MINQIITAINNTSKNKRQFLNSETAYTRESYWSFNMMLYFKFSDLELQRDMILINFISILQTIHIKKSIEAIIAVEENILILISIKKSIKNI